MVLDTSPGVLRDVYFSGFPTFKHLPYTGEVKSIGAKVFDMPSRNSSMVIKLDRIHLPAGLEDLQNDPKSLIGQEVFVGWPHLSVAKVGSLSDANTEWTVNGPLKNHPALFAKQVKTLTSQ